MSENWKKEIEKNKQVNDLETSREDRFLAFIGGKIILYILTIVILLGIAIYLYTEISYVFTPINTIVSSIITPIILAYVFYYILNPLVNLFSDNAYMQVVIEYINNNLNTSKISSEAVTIATSVAQGVASSLSATATILMTMPFVLFFLLKDASNFKEYLVGLLPKKLKKPVADTIDEIDNKVGSYIQGQMLVSLCIGVMLYIGYTIIGLHYGFSLATIAAFLSIVPYIGPIIAITPAMLVAASTSWIMVVKMLVVWGVVQFLEANIISPNIMGKSMDMHPLTVIFVILIGVNLAGVVGAILGIPVYSMLKVLGSKIQEAVTARYNKYYD